MADSTLSRRQLNLILLGLTVFSAVIRFVRLNHIPPGMWFDEAWVSVVARDWGNELYYAASFGGMHPAIVYLTKIGHALTNQHPLTIRYVVATVGTLTVPLTFFTVRPLFRLTGFTETDWLSLMSAAILSITYPFFHFSRLGFESILPAPFALVAFALCAWLIQRQLVRSTWVDPVALLLGGWLGLTIYTFDTARFIPIAVAVAFILVWIRHRKEWRLPQAFSILAIVTLVAVIVAAPLLRYFWLNWDAFIVRAEVTTFNTLGAGADSVPLALLRNLGATLGGLFIPGRGDGLARHNLPGRPVFDFVLALFFLIGSGYVALKRRGVLALILFPWLIITLLPVILTDNAPTYTRIFGAIPPLAILAAVGGWVLFTQMAGRWKFAVPALLALSACMTLYDYFVRWPVTPAYFNDFQTVEWDLAQRALAESEANSVFFTPRRAYLLDPTYDLLLSETDIRTLPDSGCLAYRPAETVTYVLAKNNSEGMLQTLQTRFGTEGVSSVEEIFYRSGPDVIGRVVNVNAPPPAVLLEPPAAFGEALQLMGHAPLESTVSAGSHIDLTFHWQAVQQENRQNYTLFIHLYRADDLSVPLAQLDGQPCLNTAAWFKGDVLIDQRQFQLPAELPAGRYTLALGWYDPQTFERLTITAGQPSPDNRFLFADILVE